MFIRQLSSADTKEAMQQLTEYMENSYTAAVALSLQTACTALYNSFQRAASAYRKELACLYFDYGVITGNIYYIAPGLLLDDELWVREERSHTFLVKGSQGNTLRYDVSIKLNSDKVQLANKILKAVRDTMIDFPSEYRELPSREIEGKIYRTILFRDDNIAIILGEALKGADFADDYKIEECDGRKTLMVLPKT